MIASEKLFRAILVVLSVLPCGAALAQTALPVSACFNDLFYCGLTFDMSGKQRHATLGPE